MKELPFLQSFKLGLSENNLGERGDTINYLNIFMKKIPYNLKHLTLDLSYNYLAYNQESLKIIGEGLKNL